MIFGPESIERILQGKKTETRRLVKEGGKIYGEPFGGDYGKMVHALFNLPMVCNSKGRVKWRVGGKYAVTPRRGKPQVLYCNFCHSTNTLASEGQAHQHFKDSKELEMGKWKPLFIEVTGIRKEKLLDLTEEDAKKEGFNTKADFFYAFMKINKLDYEIMNSDYDGKFNGKRDTIHLKENPFVWVLTFRRVGKNG